MVMVKPVEKKVNSHVGKVTVVKVMSHKRAPGSALIVRHKRLEDDCVAASGSVAVDARGGSDEEAFIDGDVSGDEDMARRPRSAGANESLPHLIRA